MLLPVLLHRFRTSIIIATTRAALDVVLVYSDVVRKHPENARH